MQKEFLIVDGHSMIFAWKDLATLHARRNELAREDLIKKLAAHQDATGIHVVVVFDGKGSKHDSKIDPTGIQVIYSKSGQTADSVIERLAANYSGQHTITVATNDRMEQQTVSAFGASWIDSDTMALRMTDAENALAERIKKHNRK